MWRARETTLTFSFMYLSLLMSKVYLLVNLFQSYMLPLFFSGLLSYLVGIKRRTSRSVMCKRVTFFFIYLFPPKPKFCADKIWL